MLKVTNANTFDLSDRFNGNDYKFPAGKTTMIDDDAARHIFGFGDANKESYLTRLGWMRTSGDYAEGMKLLGGFSFASAEPPDPNELIQTEEQGLAPLQQEADEEPVTDGTAKSSASTPIVAIPAAAKPSPGPRRSILDQLAGG